MYKITNIILLLIVSLLVLPFIYAEQVEVKGLVNDYADVIDSEYMAGIEKNLNNLYNTNTAQFSVVTIDSLEGQDIESYAFNLAQGNLGDEEKNNGLLLLIAVSDRKYRFEVGRGIEPILNDAKIGRIGRYYLADNFREDDYGKGIYEATLAVKDTLMGDENSDHYIGDAVYQPNTQLMSNIMVLVFFVVFFILPIIIRSARYKKKHPNMKDNDYFNAAFMAAVLFGGRGGRGGLGGFSGGGFGGGGFGGFGGGGFGGGGASGGW
jgi:uncharacterized protein